jgi:hypothetical protein
VTSRAVFFQIFPEKSIHRQRHTVKGWAIWATIVSIGWVIAFVIAESSKYPDDPPSAPFSSSHAPLVPFFSDLLSLSKFLKAIAQAGIVTHPKSVYSVSSLFDSWFGYILWACCYWHLNRGKPFSNKRHLAEWLLNVVMLVTGFFLFGAGTYASVQSEWKSGPYQI